MVSRVTVSFVEDDARFADDLAAQLRSLAEVQLLDCCQNGPQAVRCFRQRPPDVALVDLQLPGLSGFECIAQLAPELANTAFVVLTSVSDEAAVYEALKVGAVGYVEKASLLDLGEVVRRTAAGDSPMSPGIARRLVRHFQQQELQRPTPEPEVFRLSGREKMVLEALARGERYKEISAANDLNEHTLRTYIRRIYRKLSVTSRTEAVAKFLRTGST
ncbi:MAG: response regulator transcription factor [Verrucomicrobia bacterium]|nr:response regulator transcription factor [Verrucomicrobiota bacterium]